MHRKLFLLGLAPALLAGCMSPQGELASLAGLRLGMSRDIAWAKHSADLPVYDPQRETAILQTMMAEGQRQGLAPDTVRRFFAAEMEASPSVSVSQRCPFLRCGRLTVASTRKRGAKPRSSSAPIDSLSSRTL